MTPSNPPPLRQSWFGLAEVAALVQVEQRTILRWARAGKLGPLSTHQGQRRFARSYVAMLIRELPSTSSDLQTNDPSVYEEARDLYAYEADAADRAVKLADEAVLSARTLAADAALRAQRDRAVAGREADQKVALAAAEDAVASRSRADAAATRVAAAAARAAAVELDRVPLGDPAVLLRAAETSATVQAAAAKVAGETAAVALAVADSVAAAATLVAVTRGALDQAIEAEGVAAAAALDLRSMAAAEAAAAEVGVRLVHAAAADRSL